MRIAPELEVLARPIGELKADPDNARSHDDPGIDAIASSLEQFGQQKPVVIRPDGTVIAGNGTLAAALRLGATHIAAVTFQGNAAAAKAFALADNRAGELSFWDTERLSSQLDSLAIDSSFPFDVSKFGFDRVLAEVPTDGSFLAEFTADAEEPKPPPNPPRTRAQPVVIDQATGEEMGSLTLELRKSDRDLVDRAFAEAKRDGAASASEALVQLALSYLGE